MLKNIALLFLLCLPSLLFSQNKSLERLVSYIVFSESGLTEIPGMVVGIIDKDSTYYFYFGEKEKGIAEPPTADDVFEIGSVTKVLTASVYSLLEAEGELGFDDRVNAYYDNKFPYLGALTVNDLLTHSSGLPKLPLNLGEHQRTAVDPYADYGRKEMIEFIFNYKTFDKSYHYSHLGYAFLGEILAKKTGRSYENLLTERLLKPLGMKQTFLGNAGPSPTFGYSLSGNMAEPWTFQIFESSMGARSTASDLVRFLSVLLGDDQSNIGNILLQNCKEQTESSIPKVWMGRGWHIFRPKKKFYDVIAHSGVTGGHRVYMGFVPETHTAVVVLSNSEAAMSGVGNLILQSLNNNWRKKEMRSRE